MSTVYKSIPAVPVQVRSLRCLQETFEFDRDGGQHVSFTRRALQCVYFDATGVETVGSCVPETGWDLNLEPLQSKQLLLYVTRFETSKQGVCVFRFCGFEEVRDKQK